MTDQTRDTKRFCGRLYENYSANPYRWPAEGTAAEHERVSVAHYLQLRLKWSQFK